MNDDEIKHLFATRLKKLREESKLNQGELAEKVKVSRGSISFYENEDRSPDIVTLYRLSSFFNVSPEYLMGMTDNRTVSSDIKTACKTTGLNEPNVQYLACLLEASSKASQEHVYSYSISSLINTIIECIRHDENGYGLCFQQALFAGEGISKSTKDDTFTDDEAQIMVGLNNRGYQFLGPRQALAVHLHRIFNWLNADVLSFIQSIYENHQKEETNEKK